MSDCILANTSRESEIAESDSDAHLQRHAARVTPNDIADAQGQAGRVTRARRLRRARVLRDAGYSSVEALRATKRAHFRPRRVRTHGVSRRCRRQGHLLR